MSRYVRDPNWKPGKGVGAPPLVDEQTRRARLREQQSRHSRARGLAYIELSKIHRAEFDELRAIFRELIDEELGPLPGDEQ